jgi:hypothetical protein
MHEKGVISRVNTGYPVCLVVWLLVLEKYVKEGDEVH